MGVNIHDKQGKVICKIEEPVRWRDIALLCVGIDREFKNPPSIEEWAWYTAQSIADENQERYILLADALLKHFCKYEEAEGEEKERKGSATFLISARDFLCPTCLNHTIQPMYRRWFGLFGNKLVGYACTSQNYPARGIVILGVLVEKTEERP